jgi:hypothetical protein
LPTLAHELQRSCRPPIIEVVPQSVFVSKAIEGSTCGMLRGGQHGQHGSTIAVGVAVSSAEDALAVLPQDLETAIPMGAKSR